MKSFLGLGRRAAWLALGVLSLSFGAASAAEEAGELAFNNACRTCHSLKEGDNRLGPHLDGILGREAGSIPGFAFSPSLKNSKIVWDEATLDQFIESPDSVVAGNRMKPYGGMASAEDRAAIVAYLKAQLGGN
ncbi:MAG: c-type cytochrome [Propylenella sp.]